MLLGSSYTLAEETGLNKNIKLKSPVIKKKNSFSRVKIHPDILAIRTSKELAVAMYPIDKQPFYFADDNDDTLGNDAEIASAIAGSIGPDVKYLCTANAFDQIISQVYEDKANIVISKLSYNTKRAIPDNNEIRKKLFDGPKLNLRFESVVLKEKADPIFIVTGPNNKKLAGLIDKILDNNPSLEL